MLAIYIASGVTLCSLGGMSLINASIEERKGRVAYVVVFAGLAAIVMAWIVSPDGLKLEHIPLSFIEIAASLIR